MKKKSMISYAAVFLAFLALLSWTSIAPQSYVRLFNLSGHLTSAVVTGDGRLVLLEEIVRSGGRGPSFGATRIRVLELASGAPAAGPWVGRERSWLGVSGELALAVDSRESAGEEDWFEARSWKTGEVVLTNASLEALSPEIAGHLDPRTAHFTLRSDGLVAFQTDQGRALVLDPARRALVDRVPPPVAPRPVDSRQPGWRGLQGAEQRQTVTGAEPAYLHAEWLRDSATGGPIGAGHGWLAQHAQKVGDPARWKGLLISAIDATGAEAWRHSAGDYRLTAAVGAGQLVVLVLEDDDFGWKVQALELASGKVHWTTGG